MSSPNRILSKFLYLPPTMCIINHLHTYIHSCIDYFDIIIADRRQLTAYNGKVSIIQNDDSQTELLGIMLEGETLPICSSYHLSDAATDSACRQMGFTHGRVITQPPKYFILSVCTLHNF